MGQNDVIYLEGCLSENLGGQLFVSVETYISLFVLTYCENRNVDVYLVNQKNVYHIYLNPVTVLSFGNFRCISYDDKENKIPDCSLPALLPANENIYLGGLCAVLRWTIKSLIGSNEHHHCANLLGFRGNCLIACAETSVWTKFCELELPFAVKQTSEKVNSTENSCTVSQQLMRLEAHLVRPVRTHNILKRKQDIAKLLRQNLATSVSNQHLIEAKQNEIVHKPDNITLDVDFTLNNGRRCISNKEDVKSIATTLSQMKIIEGNEDFHLEHCYVEGIDLTLADIIIFPCVHYLLSSLQSEVAQFLPHVVKWYNKMFSNHAVQDAAKTCDFIRWDMKHSSVGEDSASIMIPIVEQISLYSRDPYRPKVKCRNFDPTAVIAHLNDNGIIPQHDHSIYKDFVPLNWSLLPAILHPESGDLPEKRLERKCQQLESIISAVLKIAKPGHTIVDFCAGGGHVGLLLSYFLKDCKILLVENKEASMLRARNRAQALELKNIYFFQCNLDYFKGSFDVGVSLHACGVATDLVIKRCLECHAGFVCCPCCYGSIQDNHLIKYPMSVKLQSTNISSEDFRLLAHCADRTEINTPKAKQGKYCMSLIDMDRKFFAEENDYTVMLSTLRPESCSPKHNILIGIPISQN